MEGEEREFHQIGQFVANVLVRNMELRFIWYDAVLSLDIEEDEQFDATSSFTIMSYLSIHFVAIFCDKDILGNSTVIFTTPCVYQQSVQSGTFQVFTELKFVFDFAWVRESLDNKHEKEWSNLNKYTVSLNKQCNK